MLLLILFVILVLFWTLMFYLRYLLSGYRSAGGHSFKEIFFGNMIRSNKNIGCEGEYYIYLELLKFKRRGSKILTNIYLTNTSDNITEIDLIMIDKTGIYVFESKNFSGWIFGDYRENKWTQVLGNFRTTFFNPIFQNEKHIQYINELFDGKYSQYIYSFIVFSNRCRLKKVKYSKNARVIRRCNLIRNVNQQIINSTPIFSKNEINLIYEELRKHINVSKNLKDKHIEQLKSKKNYNN